MELIVTIVVIGILASITVVAYNGMQSRARDASRDQAAAQLIKGYQMWVSRNNKTKATDLPAGHISANAGYILLTNPSEPAYSRPNAADILSQDGLLANGFINSLPTTGNPIDNQQFGNFMLYPCTNNRSILLWAYENPTAQTNSEYLKAQQDCGNDTKDYINDSTNYTNQFYAIYKMRKAKVF